MSPTSATTASTTVRSAVLLGARAHPITIHVDLGVGVGFELIDAGSDTTARELRERVRAAFLNSDLAWPLADITVTVKPPIPHAPSSLDLPIAIALLAANGTLDPQLLEDLGCFGELGLDGSVRPVAGAVPLTEALTPLALVVPEGNRRAAAMAGTVGVLRTAATLREVARWDVHRVEAWTPWMPSDPAHAEPDLCELAGHGPARRALEVAAAGGHHLIIVGLPGAGARELAVRLPGLLPRPRSDESREINRLHSAAGASAPNDWLHQRPVRWPSPRTSVVALTGGGGIAMRPGEFSLAHRGVLVLEDLQDFAPGDLQTLREPLEQGVMTVARGQTTVQFPAEFQLVATITPCPCAETECRCTAAAIARHNHRLLGWLFSRFGMRIQLPLSPPTRPAVAPESSRPVAERVSRARERSSERGGKINNKLSKAELDEFGPLDADGREVLHAQLRAGTASPQDLLEIHRVALTLADLKDLHGRIPADYVREALALRLPWTGRR